MATAQDLIKGAYRSIGVIGRGKTLSSFLGQQGLEALNQMLGMWSTQSFLIPSRTSEDIAIPSFAISFTIGTGGELNTTRPIEIVDGYISAGGTDYPLTIFTLGEFNDITYKNSGNLPGRMWYEPSYPLGKVFFDCKIDDAYTLHIESYKPLSSLATLSTSFSLPEGYEEAIKFNLALRLAPENGKNPSAIVVGLATEGVKMLKSVRGRQRIPMSKLDNMLSGNNRYNVINDGYNT